MNIETGQLYHIYNRGNNSQKIFYNRDNYLFFLRKIREYIIRYADILAWALMPNHFHIMVYVERTTSVISNEILNKTTGEILSKDPQSRTFNNSVGIMLRSYARAIQKQEKMTGSLFQEHTKASCLTNPDVRNFNWFYEDNELQNCHVNSKEDYPVVCFDYIHENPVNACHCQSITGWEFSSAADYFAGRKGKLINKERAKEFNLLRDTIV